MSTTRRPVISTQILAGRQPFEEGVFAIGPFATRVSFSSQQRRAFAVVSEMDEDLRRSGRTDGLKNLDVCIVGAGLAGLSCALAVAAYGGQAFVYEAEDRRRGARDDLDSAMPTTRNAAHRVGHPSLNLWPWEDLDPITRLPALNWFEASCPDIANVIAEDFRTFQRDEDLRERLLGIRFGCRVTGMSKVAGKWRLDVERSENADEPWSTNFDIVLLALGFGPEEGASFATPGYWDGENDAVDTVREMDPPAFGNFVVSGVGDGGLIEALRLLFKPMRAGAPTESFLQILHGPRLRGLVSNIEYQLSIIQSDYMIHDGGLDSAQVAEDLRSTMSSKVWDKYEALVKVRVTHNFVGVLSDVRTTVPKVILTGLRPSPLELSSSPYHRILIAVAIGMDWAEYWQVTKDQGFSAAAPVNLGKSTYDSTSLSCTRLRRIWRGTAASKGLRFQTDDARATLTLDKCFFLARHGPHPRGALGRVFADDKVVNQFRRQQALYADHDLFKDQHVARLAKLLKKPDPGDAVSFASQTTLINDYFSYLGLESAFKHKLEGGEIHVMRLSGATRPKSPAPLPKYIWGLPVSVQSVPRFDPSGAPRDDGA